MDNLICINTNSFPAPSRLEGYGLFNDALQGVLNLQNGSDRFLFCLDSTKNLGDFEIAQSYTYQDFCEECVRDDADLALFLFEVEDKSPALDMLQDDQFIEMSEFIFYAKNRPADKHLDIFAIAWFLSAYLISIKTDPYWDSSTIEIARIDGTGRFIDEQLTLKNIASFQHGKDLFKEINEIDLDVLCTPHVVTSALKDWFNELSNENKMRVNDKVGTACLRDFQGGMPLFKQLENANGLKEIRFSAYSGGAIRILFKKLINEPKYALLFGFIKHSDNDGYDYAVKESSRIYNILTRPS